MAYIISNPAGYLLSAQTTSGVGNMLDTRLAANYALIQHASTTPSAVIKLQASVDGNEWLDVATYTATTTTGTAQIAGYYPYVRGIVNSAFGNAGNTGSASFFYAPGLK